MAFSLFVESDRTHVVQHISNTRNAVTYVIRIVIVLAGCEDSPLFLLLYSFVQDVLLDEE
jgi:hypothetical protein